MPGQIVTKQNKNQKKKERKKKGKTTNYNL